MLIQKERLVYLKELQQRENINLVAIDTNLTKMRW